MKSLFKISALAVVAVLASGCSDYQTVPPAHVGKILGKDGYKVGELLQPGNHDIGWERKIDNRLILVDLSINTYNEPMEMVLSDRQTLVFEVKVKTRINRDNQAILDGMFNIISPDLRNTITLKNVYAKYGMDLVRMTAREVVGPYTLEEIQENYGKISHQIDAALAERFKSTPLRLEMASLGGIKFPETYTIAVEEEKSQMLQQAINKNREEAKRALFIEQEKTILVEQRVRIAKAETLRLENLKTKDGLSPLLLEYEKLRLEADRIEVDRIMAENIKDGKGANTIYYPMGKKPAYVDFSLGNQTGKGN
jgi:hypothetical protein